MNEAEFQGIVVDMATLLGWQHLHVRRSIGKGRKWVTATNVPWPDLTLWRAWRPSSECEGHGRVRPAFLVRELKLSAASPWQPGQRELLESLKAAGVDADVWYLSDLDERVPFELGARRREAA